MKVSKNFKCLKKKQKQMLVISVFKRLRQENWKPKASLGYTMVLGSKRKVKTQHFLPQFPHSDDTDSLLIHWGNGRTFFKGYVDVFVTFLTSEKKNIWLSNLRKVYLPHSFRVQATWQGAQLVTICPKAGSRGWINAGVCSLSPFIFREHRPRDDAASI